MKRGRREVVWSDVPRSERTKLTIEVPKVLWARVKHIAIDERRKVWLVVARALEMYLEEAEKRAPGKGGGHEKG
jgi:predicted transcriptional regulator